MVVNGVLCALTNLPQLHKESTINAVTVKSHLLMLVVEDITKRYSCWKGLENGQDKLLLVDFPPSSTKTQVDASMITLPTEK